MEQIRFRDIRNNKDLIIMNLGDYTEGGIGAILGAGLAILGFRGRLNGIEQSHQEFKKETKIMFREIRADIKTLIAKSANRRIGD